MSVTRLVSMLKNPASSHLPDETLLLELEKSPASQRPADLQPLRHNARGDELVGGNLLVQLVIRALQTCKQTSIYVFA
jgi:hypothetical protein